MTTRLQMAVMGIVVLLVFGLGLPTAAGSSVSDVPADSGVTVAHVGSQAEWPNHWGTHGPYDPHDPYGPHDPHDPHGPHDPHDPYGPHDPHDPYGPHDPHGPYGPHHFRGPGW